jgi:hypothetical protein
VLGTLCLAALILNLDTTIVNVALPALVRRLGATTSGPAVGGGCLQRGIRRLGAGRGQHRPNRRPSDKETRMPSPDPADHDVIDALDSLDLLAAETHRRAGVIAALAGSGARP